MHATYTRNFDQPVRHETNDRIPLRNSKYQPGRFGDIQKESSLKRKELKRIISSFPRNEPCRRRDMTRLKLSVCPTCGKQNLKTVRRTVSGTRRGKRYSVPGVEFY